MHDDMAVRTRRTLLKNGLALTGALALTSGARATQRLTGSMLRPIAQPPIPAASFTSPRVVRPELFRRALTALNQHSGIIAHRDRIAIADFTAPSSQPRFHIVDMVSGRSTSFLVAHGSGSDPSHSGFLRRFSNDFGSNASCEGAFVTADYYNGKHGRSQRLMGLDATNGNALGRGIVVHSAWYSNPDMLRTHGMLGRSQGCFAVGEHDLDQVFASLGPGRMIFSAKV